MKYVDEFRSTGAALSLLDRISGVDGGPYRFMEVCGTHSMAISRFGLRPLLAPRINLVSGPGCPVCVTTDSDIDRAVAIAQLPGVRIATFGDMLRVPGTAGSLSTASVHGADVNVIYSPLEALALAREDTSRRTVLIGAGFETTAPTIAATLLRARRERVENLFLLSLHKLVAPALRALLEMKDFTVDGFVLPGHVCAVTGTAPYDFIPREFGVPCVVAGFEPVDILEAVWRLMENGPSHGGVMNSYSRIVRDEGNPKALTTMNAVFEGGGAEWRGLGFIPESGLFLREEYAEFDAGRWEVELPAAVKESGCQCGDVLCGRITPDECPLFGTACTPADPVGPCMISGEGACAAYYLYRGDENGDR